MVFPITDKYIERIKAALESIDVFSLNCLQGKTKETALKNLTRVYFTLAFRLDWCHYTYTSEEAALIFIEDNYQDELYKNAILEVLRTDSIDLDMVENEFWQNLPNPSLLSETLDLYRIKFKRVLSEIPDPREYSIETVCCEGNTFYNKHLDDIKKKAELKKCDYLTEKETDFVLLKICGIIELVNIAVDALNERFIIIKGRGLYPQHTEQKKPMPSTDTKLHFTSVFSREMSEKLYNDLKGTFISESTEFDNFLYWFTGGEPPINLAPIEWKKSQILLAFMIDQCFADNGLHHWKTAEAAFLVKGESPKSDSMKKDVSKSKDRKNGIWINPPRDSDILYRILKPILS